MSEWWSYRPQDFLLFSERVYWRLFELHNAAVWPAQLVAFAAGAAILVALFRPQPWSSRLILLALAAAWVFVAWSFLWTRYAPVNWAARYVVPFFGLQALLFVWRAGFGRQPSFRFERGVRDSVGLALFAYALAVHPLTALFAGRPIAGSEIFGLAPDPTAIGTLGLLVIARPAARIWPLVPIPLLWCAASWLTLDTMGTPEAWILLAATVVACGVLVLPQGERAR